MSKNIFLSYAGRTVKTAFDGSSTDELASYRFLRPLELSVVADG
jgi:hypothetical protein